jgi:hypothetical protein
MNLLGCFGLIQGFDRIMFRLVLFCSYADPACILAGTVFSSDASDCRHDALLLRLNEELFELQVRLNWAVYST